MVFTYYVVLIMFLGEIQEYEVTRRRQKPEQQYLSKMKIPVSFHCETFFKPNRNENNLNIDTIR